MPENEHSEAPVDPKVEAELLPAETDNVTSEGGGAVEPQTEPQVVEFKRVEPDVREGLEKMKAELPGDCVLLALRCPCGFMIGLQVPTTIFEAREAQTLSVNLASNFVSKLVDHIQLLDERLKMYDATPTRRRGPDFPSREDVVKSYHNHPCPLRLPLSARKGEEEKGVEPS